MSRDQEAEIAAAAKTLLQRAGRCRLALVSPCGEFRENNPIRPLNPRSRISPELAFIFE